MADGFDQFVSEVSPRLVRAARMLLGGPADAQDVTQETLISVYWKWDQLRDRTAASSYAYTTLVRRSRRHRQRAHFRRECLTAPDALPVFAAAAVLEPSDQDIGRALASLPPRQREALVLRYYLDLSIPATASAMRCTEGTVKSTTSKALAALRATVCPAAQNGDHR